MKFTVYGKPQPQGSSRAFMVKGRPVITSTNKNLKSWRQEVSVTAQASIAMSGEVIIARPHAVNLRVDFYFDRPQSLKKSLTENTKRPDMDKLLRGLSDALTGIAYEDDAQIIALTAAKHYGSPERTEVSLSSTERGFHALLS
jgi:crossover junction endodeoxyribonuclease RusA